MASSVVVDQRADGGARDRREEWLFGRGVDLLIGCGLAYILLMPLLLWVAEATGTHSWPSLATMLMFVFASSPHYGATIVRVYDARHDRWKYALFSVWFTIALALLLFASTRNVWISSLLITAYVIWSPWHFSGQNYGLALMFLRRRHIEVDHTTKRLLYASFLLSAVLAMLAIQSGRDDMVFAPSTLHVANAPTILHLPLSATLANVAALLCGLAYLACLAGAGWRLRGRAPLRDFVPAVVLVATQMLWFTVPAVLIGWDHARSSTLIFSAAWISAAHAVQYLWVTAYYERSSKPATPVVRFLLKAVMAGMAVAVFPAFLLAPHRLGKVPWDVGLATTIFAVVNLHHFVLDGAIWKLRDGRVARILLRDRDSSSTPGWSDAPPRRPWLRRLVWTAAAIAVPIQGMWYYAQWTIETSDRSDRVESARRMIRWIGREGILLQFAAGQRLAAAGDHAGAIEQFRHSIEEFPTARTWKALGDQYQKVGRSDLAVGAFDAALDLDPDFWVAHLRRAETLLALDPTRRDPKTSAEATRSLERVLELRPGTAAAALLLADLRAETLH